MVSSTGHASMNNSAICGASSLTAGLMVDLFMTIVLKSQFLQSGDDGAVLSAEVVGDFCDGFAFVPHL